VSNAQLNPWIATFVPAEGEPVAIADLGLLERLAAI